MAEKVKLNEKEKEVLKECDEEGIRAKNPGPERFNLNKEELFKVLKKLQDLKLVYYSKEVDMFFSTLEGSKELTS